MSRILSRSSALRVAGVAAPMLAAFFVACGSGSSSSGVSDAAVDVVGTQTHLDAGVDARKAPPGEDAAHFPPDVTTTDAGHRHDATTPRDAGRDSRTSEDARRDVHHDGPVDSTARDTGHLVDAGQPDALPAIPLTAAGGVYSMQVTIGGTQEFQVSIDTGSTTLAIASSTCAECNVAPTYTPGPTATDEHTLTTGSYTATDSNTTWTGEVYDDSVHASAGPTVPVKLAAINTESGFYFEAGQLQGILGLAPAGSAFTGTNGFFDQLVASGHVADVFATELCPTGGTLWLGGYDQTFTTAVPQYTPIPQADPLATYAYPVNLASVTLAGTTVPIATAEHPDSVVDDGTAPFVVSTSAFNALAGAIQATPNFAQVFGGADGGVVITGDGGTETFLSSGACVTVSQSQADLDAMFPPLTLTFGSDPAIAVQALATESYLQPFTYEGSTCWYSGIEGVDPAEISSASILGTAVQASSVVIFDRAKKRIGFAPHTPCP